MPISWQHFQYGTAWMARDHLRQQAAAAEAARIAQDTKEGYAAFQADVRTMTQPT